MCNDTFAMRPQAIYYSTGFQQYSTVIAVFVDMCAKCKFHLEKTLPVVACYLNYSVRSSYIFMMKRWIRKKKEKNSLCLIYNYRDSNSNKYFFPCFRVKFSHSFTSYVHTMKVDKYWHVKHNMYIKHIHPMFQKHFISVAFLDAVMNCITWQGFLCFWACSDVFYRVMYYL